MASGGLRHDAAKGRNATFVDDDSIQPAVRRIASEEPRDLPKGQFQEEVTLGTHALTYLAKDYGTLGGPKNFPRNRSTRRRSFDSVSGVESSIASAPTAFNHQLVQLRKGVMYGLEGYNSRLNVLLLFVPLGIFAGWAGWPKHWIFVFNFLACVPLAMILGRATEDVASHTNNTIGGLMNATFGNAVELILSISALRAGLLDVIKCTLVGSILSNLLLVLGSSFLCGGLLYREQSVMQQVVEANGDVMMFAVFGFVLPSLFALAIPESMPGKQNATEVFSLITAICLLCIYCMFLIFQLYTHVDLYEEAEKGHETAGSDEENGLTKNANVNDSTFPAEEAESEEPEPVASMPVAMTIMIVDVLFVSICCEFLVGSIEEFSHKVGLGADFIALILLPIIGNAVEHFSAIMVAMKDKMDLSIGIACGSSLQIAVFAAPLLVVVSWILGGPKLTLSLDVFQAVCVWLSVTVVNMTLRDARTNWLEGAVLLFCYVIIASAFFLREKVA